jgi:hypothetical protein
MSPGLSIFSWDSPKISNFRFFAKFSEMSPGLLKTNVFTHTKCTMYTYPRQPVYTCFVVVAETVDKLLA